jgi:hypothetical protein
MQEPGLPGDLPEGQIAQQACPESAEAVALLHFVRNPF